MKFVRQSIWSAGILAAISLSASASEPQKNFCSMTFRSNIEPTLFRDHLESGANEGKWQSHELTDSKGDDWLDQACAAPTKCDILLFSGHFAGVFFDIYGEGRTLELRKLEKLSCNETCPGLLESPAEVWFYACNTLAGKSKDSRNPQEYYNVLTKDRYSDSDAQLMAEARYGEIGFTYEARMSFIFHNSPEIFGFYSTSPLGIINGPHVTQYLNSPTAQNYSQHIDDLRNWENRPYSSLDDETNWDALDSHRGIHFAESHGIDTIAHPEALQSQRLDYCAIVSDPKQDRDLSSQLQGKLETIEKVMNRSDFLKYFTAIEGFFVDHPEYQIKLPFVLSLTTRSDFSKGETEALDDLRRNQTGRQILYTYFEHLKKTPYRDVIRANIQHFALSFMGWQEFKSPNGESLPPPTWR
jgi:hypothetical protein